MRWLTSQTTQQTILLTALFLLMAVATILLACGPVAQPAPADDVALPAAQDGGGSSEPTAEPTVEPTPTPELDCLQAPQLPGGEICIEPPPPKALPKYPALGNKYAEAAEAAQAAAGASGASGQSDAETPNLFVLISMDNKTSTDALVLWLESNGVNRFSNWSEGDAGRISSFRDDYIYAYVPASLLVPLSRQGGIISIEDGCLTSFHC